MNPSLELSLRAYERLLILYPEDLRRDFGADMLEAFADDLAAAPGIRGAFCLWRSTLREVLQIAVPAWCDIPGVVVPLLSAAIFASAQSPLIILAARRQLLTELPDALISVGIGSVISAIISFVAIYRWKRAGLITLCLS